MSLPRLTWGRAAISLLALLVAAAALVAWLNVRGEDPLTGSAESF